MKSRRTACWRSPPGSPSTRCLSLFPAIAAGVSVYALFADAATISKHLSVAAGIVPAGTLDLLDHRDLPHRRQERRQAHLRLSAGLGIALWSANAGMKAIFDALNIIYDEEEKRGLIRLNVVSLFFTVCAIAASAWRSAWWSCFRWFWPRSG